MDVSVAVGNEPYESASGIRLVYALRNRCDRPLELDFSAVGVNVAYAEGASVALAASPGRATLDNLDVGGEAVWYAGSDTPDERPIQAVCVDVSHLEVGNAVGVGTEVGAPAAPICVRRTGAGFVYVGAADDAARVRDSHHDLGPAAIRKTSTSFVGERCEHGYVGARAYDWCDAFASWSRSIPISFTIGASTHHYDLRGRNTGEVGAPFSRAYGVDALGSAQGETVDTRLAWFPLAPLYLGTELDLGGAALAHGAKLSSNPDLSVNGGGVMLAAGLFVGIAAPRIGPFAASVEGFGGVWLIGTSTSSSASCTDADGTGPCQVNLADWWVEPRVRLETWLTPHVSIDAWAGAGVLHAGDWSSGIALTAHLRSFDGTP